MRKNVWKAAAAAIAVCMLVMVAASLFIEGCTKMLETTAGNMVPMKCHWVFVATAIVGIVGLVGALCSFVCSTKEGRRVSSILVAVCAVADNFAWHWNMRKRGDGLSSEGFVCLGPRRHRSRDCPCPGCQG